MTLFRAPIIVLDTETTGFPSHHWARVIEIAGVKLDEDGETVGSFSSVVRPDILDGRADKALEINQITRDEIAAARPTEEVAALFRAWGGATYLTAFNVAFDMPMIERMGLTGHPWASCIMERSMAIMGPAGVLRQADPTHPRYEPGRPWLWPSLAAAGEFFGVPPCEPAHRALSDARRAAGIAVAIRRRMLGAA